MSARPCTNTTRADLAVAIGKARSVLGVEAALVAADSVTSYIPTDQALQNDVPPSSLKSCVDNNKQQQDSYVSSDSEANQGPEFLTKSGSF